jgi:hypothetical protein
MISDTNEKTEPPPPLTQREMNQFITLAALPTLERALERLRWLEAENAALKADPLAGMWRELAEYQEQADRDGHGESWRVMCAERTDHSAWSAARAAARPGPMRAVEEACWDAGRAAAVDAESARDAIAAIRKAKEARP